VLFCSADRPPRSAAVVLAVLALAITLPVEASAEGLFDMLFGGFKRAAAPSQPSPGFGFSDPFGAPVPGTPEQPVGSGRGYCVRLCDGRYFPVQHHGEASAVQQCSQMCPGSQTKVFSGGAIERAVSADGGRYSDLGTAFLYRSRLVQNCTCNGRDAFGLAPIDISADPTLRPGDVVATPNGMMAFTGARSRRGLTQGSDFTPIENYSGLSADTRNRLATTTVAPAN